MLKFGFKFVSPFPSHYSTPLLPVLKQLLPLQHFISFQHYWMCRSFALLTFSSFWEHMPLKHTNSCLGVSFRHFTWQIYVSVATVFSFARNLMLTLCSIFLTLIASSQEMFIKFMINQHSLTQSRMVCFTTDTQFCSNYYTFTSVINC